MRSLTIDLSPETATGLEALAAELNAAQPAPVMRYTPAILAIILIESSLSRYQRQPANQGPPGLGKIGSPEITYAQRLAKQDLQSIRSHAVPPSVP